ncbi:ABC transporter substrate-binding protein [Pigmentibacter ruber]|uniref:ABC transporter substrate-binding protein n=1 Tax=Pigmentibacter ruber TaxID=2683196 RepID=UPI00131C8DEF|nr:ABC transporter substrate-binding protein [Pigmentibacter ruber]
MRFITLILSFLLNICFFSSAHSSAEYSYQKKTNYYETMPPAKKGGVLHFPISSDPKVMNPLLSDDTASSAVEGYLWLSLFSIDPETLEFIPNLAKDFKVSADKKNYTFTLYESAKWQDGSSVTTDDIKFSFDTLMDTKTHAAALRSFFEGVTLKIIDKQSFVFSISEPRFDTLNVLASFTPIQKKQFENTKDFNLDKGIMNPVGNAAYIFDKFLRSQKIIFKRNKNWWAKDLPHFKNRFNPDEIILDIIPDPNLTYEKFLKGDVDQISFTAEQWHNKVTNIDKNKFGTKQNEKPIWSLKVKNKFPKPYNYIAWNLKNSLFSDVKTRTALSYLVDYNKILEKIFFNLYTQSTSPFGSFTENSAPELRSKQNIISFNKEKAISLLKEAGWKNDGSGILTRNINGKIEKFEFNLDINSNNTTRQKIAEIVKENFKSVGIKVNIRSYEWNTFLDLINKRKFEAVILAWTGSLFPNAKQIWDSESESNEGSNFVSYSNPKVDELIKKANIEFNSAKRQKIMQEINRIIYHDQPYTFIAEVNYVLEGLNSKIYSSRWIANYESGAASDLFYLVK